MKRLLSIVTGLVIAALFAYTLLFLYQKSRKPPVLHTTETPTVADIVKKTVASGAIVPRREIEIKPRISGIVDKLHVRPGEYVRAGQLIASIRIVPDMVRVSEAESRLKTARIKLENARRERDRFRGLLGQRVVSETDYARHEDEFRLAEQDVSAAENQLSLIREGASRRSGQISNQVNSTVEGMVLAVPVKEGESVIESNTFNAGTTIAFVADMNDMIFQGKVDESEVGKLREGMELAIQIGALEEHRFQGVLEYIAPKGVKEEGTIQFEIRAALGTRPDVFIRANYSANADIVLARRSRVLTISEALLQFEGKEPYVEVETRPDQFERRKLRLGLSDGIRIEVLEGVTAASKIKRPS
jgi:HlyD family secretion protein